MSDEPTPDTFPPELTRARDQVARSVNTEMVRAYWLVGREIVEEEQRGESRSESAFAPFRLIDGRR